MARIQTRKGKKGTTYTATVRLKGHPPIARTFDRMAMARDWAREVEAAIKAKRYNDPRRADITLDQALERYEINVSSTKATTTQAREKWCMKVLRERLGKETLLPEITPSMVAAYRDERMQEVSAYSVRLELALLSHLFRKAKKEWELPVENPVNDIERPAPPPGRTHFLKEKEMQDLLAQCRARSNPLLYPYVLVLLHTAMRPGEAAALRCGQIDIDRRTIDLQLTKNKDYRRVQLTEAAAEALRPLVKNRKDDDLVFMTDRQATGYAAIIPSQVFRESFNEAKKAAGLPWLHMHDLRHTAASWMLMRGVDMRTLAEILGHRTLQMVRRYTHLLDEHKRAAVDRIGDLGIKGTF